MQENQEVFYTVARHKKLLIFDIDQSNQKIRMKRSTGKITWALDYQKIKDVHDQIHNGELKLDQYAIAKEVPTWGTYITALLTYLGTERIA